MIFEYISKTDLQRNPDKVFSKFPFKIVLNNNKQQGMFISQETVDVLMKSGVLNQIREELFELQDKETIKVIAEHKSGKSKTSALDTFTEKYEL